MSKLEGASAIEAIGRAIAALAISIESVPRMPSGKLSCMVDRIAELTAQRAELIRQETSQWRTWAGADECDV